MSKRAMLSFPSAITAVSAGGRITKTEWGNAEVYGELRDGKLQIKLADGLWHPWIISDGDLAGQDWYVLD